MKNDAIDNGREFDWGKTSAEYARYRDIYPASFYERIADRGLCVNGQQALDLGTGTGVLPRNFYSYGAQWTGTDLSENQIAQAQRLAQESGMDIRFFAAPAEATGLAEASFDVITACQCFHYFDRALVMPEIRRMLKPGGHFLILFMEWLPFESEIAAKTEELVLKYNPEWSGAGVTRKEPAEPEWAERWLSFAGADAYAENVPFTRETWHGRIIACRGVGASSLSEAELDAFKKEHWDYMLTLPERFTIPHYITMIDLKRD